MPPTLDEPFNQLQRLFAPDLAAQPSASWSPPFPSDGSAQEKDMPEGLSQSLWVSGLTYRELRDGTGTCRVGFPAHWRSENDNPALANSLKLLWERYALLVDCS